MRKLFLMTMLSGCHMILPLQGETDSGLDPPDETVPTPDGVIQKNDLDGTPDDFSTLDDLQVSKTPCVPGITTHQVYSSQMVLCLNNARPAPGTVNQCEAASLCAAGWHICGVSEFLDRGGRSIPSKTAAWLSGCVRSGKTPHKPSDVACACDLDMGKNEPVHWECGGGVIGTTSYEHVGVMSWSKCFAVGEQGVVGYWISQPAVLKLSAAMCCK